MDRGLSRSLPFLPRYHSVSPVRAPRRYSSTRSLSQPSQRIIYIEGERSRLSNHYANHPQHSPRHVSPFHSLASPAPRCKAVKVFLVNTKLNTPLFRKSKSNSWNDINSSHFYSSLESIHSRQKKIFNKPEVTAAGTSNSCDDIYHKGPFFPDASHSESGISVGESEEDGREDREETGEEDDTDAATEYSYASSSAFFETTMDSEFDKGESDNDVFSPDGKLSPAVWGGHGHGRNSSDRSTVMSPLSSYAETRKRELMSSPSWEMLEKMVPSRQQYIQNQSGILRVTVPDSDYSKSRSGASTPLAQSTPHVSPRSFYGPPMLTVKGSWNADSPRSDSVISSQAMSSLSEIDSTSNSHCSSFSEDYDLLSDCASPKSKSASKIKLKKKLSERPMASRNISVLSSRDGEKNHLGDNDKTTIGSFLLKPPDIDDIPPLESVIDLDESTLGSKSDEDDEQITPRSGQWWAVYNIESAKARKMNEENEDGASNSDFCSRGEVKIVKPVKTAIPLISAGKYGQEKLKKTSSSPPPDGSEGNGKFESNRPRTLSLESNSNGSNIEGPTRTSPPLLSLSPTLQERIAKKESSESKTVDEMRNEYKIMEGEQFKGRESEEFIRAISSGHNNVGNLPCLLTPLDPKEQQGVSSTSTTKFQVTTDLDRLTAHASTIDDRRCVDLSDDNSVRFHGQQIDHQNNPITMSPSVTDVRRVERRNDEVEVEDQSTLVLANNHHRHYLLDNSDCEQAGDSLSAIRDQKQREKTEKKADKLGYNEGAEIKTPSTALAHNGDSNINLRRSSECENKQVVVLGVEEAVSGAGGGQVGVRDEFASSKYVLPVEDTKVITSSKTDTNNTAKSPFNQYQSSEKDTRDLKSACVSGDDNVECNGVSSSDFKTLNFDFDDCEVNNKRASTSFDESLNVVNLCQDFQALSLTDLDTDVTPEDNAIGQVWASDSLDKGRGNIGGNENVNKNIDTVTRSNAPVVSIRKDTAVETQHQIKNKIKSDDDPIESELNSRMVRDETETEVNVNKSVKQCVPIVSEDFHSNSNNSSLSCLNCRREEKKDGEFENIEVEFGQCHHCEILQNSQAIDQVSSECMVKGSEEERRKNQRGITDEHEIEPDAAAATAHIPPVAVEDDNNNTITRDNNGSGDEVVFDVRDNKILLTLSTTPGNIISITHTATPISMNYTDGSGCGGGCCSGDDSQTASGEIPVYSNFKLPYSVNDHDDNTNNERRSDEEIMPQIMDSSNNRPQQQHPFHYYSNNNGYYKDGGDGAHDYYPRTVGIPEDGNHGGRGENDSDVLWRQGGFSQDYHYNDDNHHDNNGKSIGGEIEHGVSIVNGDKESINLSFAGDIGIGDASSGCSRSGHDRVNKGIPHQHAQNVGGGVGGRGGEIREIIITNAQKDDDGKESGGDSARQSTTQRRVSDNNKNSGDREFLLQQEKEHLFSDRQTPVTAAAGDKWVNYSSSPPCATTTTKIVKKIHRKTVEETVTIERTVQTPTNYYSENKRSGVYSDTSVNTGGFQDRGQSSTSSGRQEESSDSHSHIILDSVSSSTDKKEETVFEEKVDYISTCELRNSNIDTVRSNENNTGYFDQTVSTENIVDHNANLYRTNDAERSDITNPLTSEPFNSTNNYTNATTKYGEKNHVNNFSSDPEGFDNKHRNDNIVIDAMRGDTNNKMREGSSSIAVHPNNSSQSIFYTSPGFEIESKNNNYDMNSSSPVVHSLPTPNRSFLDNLQAQLSNISNGCDGNVMNITPPTTMVHNVAVHQRHNATAAIDRGDNDKSKTYYDHGQAMKQNNDTHYYYNQHDKNVSGISGHDSNQQHITTTTLSSISTTTTTTPQHHKMNSNGVSIHGMTGGQMSPSSPSHNMQCVTGGAVTLASNTSSQNTVGSSEIYDNNDYDYVTSDSNSSNSSNNSQSLPRNNHHHLVLLKPGHVKPSSLWTLQEETESLLEGLSPKQATSPTRPFHSFAASGTDSMDLNNYSVIYPNNSVGEQNTQSTHFPPPPVEFMDDNKMDNNNIYNRCSSSADHGLMNRVSDYSEVDQSENDSGSSCSFSQRSARSSSLNHGANSNSIDQEVARSLNDLETTLRALNGGSKFNYSSNQRPEEASLSLHVPPSSATEINSSSFYDFVSGLGTSGDFTFNFANTPHASCSEMETSNGITISTDSQHQRCQPSLISPGIWKQQNTVYSPNNNFDNRSASFNNEDILNSSIASSSNVSSNQDTQSEASSRLQILDLDLSRISSCTSPVPSDLSEGSAYTCRGTAEIKKNLSVSFDDDYDMLPAISAPKFVPSSTPRKQTMKLKSALKKPAISLENNSNLEKFTPKDDNSSNSKHALWAEQFDKIIEDFNDKTCRLGPDSDIAILEGRREGLEKEVESNNGDNLYKTFVNDYSEKKQNHVCIVEEPENIDTFRFKRFLKKSHTRRNNKGKRIVRFLSKLSCVSESVQSSPEHYSSTACTKKARLANGNAYTTESMPLPAEREPVVLTASSASRLAHHNRRMDSPTQFISHKDDHSPSSSIQSLDSLRSRTDSAYSSVSESVVMHSPQSQKITNDLHPHSSHSQNTVNIKINSPSSSTRLLSHPDSAFSSMSESNTLSISSLPDDHSGNYSSDMLSALSDVFDQLDVCEEEIDQALLNRIRYSHHAVPHKRNN